MYNRPAKKPEPDEPIKQSEPIYARIMTQEQLQRVHPPAEHWGKSDVRLGMGCADEIYLDYLGQVFEVELVLRHSDWWYQIVGSDTGDLDIHFPPDWILCFESPGLIYNPTFKEKFYPGQDGFQMPLHITDEGVCIIYPMKGPDIEPLSYFTGWSY